MAPLLGGLTMAQLIGESGLCLGSTPCHELEGGFQLGVQSYSTFSTASDLLFIVRFFGPW